MGRELMPESLRAQVDSFAAAVGQPPVQAIMAKYSAAILPFRRNPVTPDSGYSWWADPDR